MLFEFATFGGFEGDPLTCTMILALLPVHKLSAPLRALASGQNQRSPMSPPARSGQHGVPMAQKWPYPIRSTSGQQGLAGAGGIA